MTLSVWRICTTKGLTLDLLSYGSTLAKGRWHLPPPDGAPVVYAGASRAICQLEKRVHCNGVRPIGQALIRLDLPDGALAEDVRKLVSLPANWIDQEALTQSIGVTWRTSASALGLWVPSAVEPHENNLILNPDHPDFKKIKVVIERDPFEFDSRMFP